MLFHLWLFLWTAEGAEGPEEERREKGFAYNSTYISGIDWGVSSNTLSFGLCQALIEKNIQIFPLDCAADLVNVWAYVEAYPDEIESAIRRQDEADEILDTPENIK
jgi:hypothetical protein